MAVTKQEVMAALGLGGGRKERYVRHEGQTTVKERAAMVREAMIREAELTQAMGTPEGLTKIAANMANPVRFRLDYKSIFRKHCVVPETIRGGEVTDLPELTRTRVVWRYTNGGEARVVEPGVPKVLNVSGL